MSIRRRLFLILLSLTTIPILALGATLTLQSLGNLLNEISEGQRSVASEVALQAEDTFTISEVQAELFIHQNNLFALSQDELKVALTGFMSFQKNIEQISLVDHTGSELVRVSQSQIVRDDDLRNHASDNNDFLIPFQTGKTYFSPIVISEATNEPLIIIAIPIINQRTGKPDGIFIMDTKMMVLWELMEQRFQETGQEVFITTEDGQVVAHPNRSVVLRGERYNPSPDKYIVPGLDGSYSVIGISLFQAGNQQFNIIATQPISHHYNKLVTSITIILVTIGLTLLVVFVLAVQFGNSISRPIIRLAQSAQALETGNLDQSADINSNDEIGILAASFNSMARKIQEQITTLIALQDSTLTIINELDLNRVLQAIQQQVIHLLDVDDSFIYLVEPDQSRIRLHLATGVNETYIGTKLKSGEGLAGAIWKSGQSLLVENYGTWAGRSKFYEAVPLYAIAGTPLIASGEVLGVLGINHRNPEKVITTEDMELLDKFGNLASIAVGNARLYNLAQEEIKERKKAEDHAIRQVERLNALHDIDLSITTGINIYTTLGTILRKLVLLIEVDAASVLLFDPIMDTFEIGGVIGFHSEPRPASLSRLHAGLAGQAAREQKMVYVNDVTKNPIHRSGFVDEEEGFVSYYGIPLFIKNELQGVLEVYHRSELKLDNETTEFLQTLATQTAIAMDNYTMFDNLQQTNRNLQTAYETTLEGWSAALDLRDKETEGHTKRVTELTLKLARSLGVSENELLHIRRGSLLHDIGKMGIPDSILQKPGKLTRKERQIIEQHPIFAYNLLSPIPYLQQALDIPYCHHEKWDGTGYPRQIDGEKIPFAARLFAVVDVYDALTSTRPYREGWSKQKAIKYIKAESGSHFDPDIVVAFIKMMLEEPPDTTLLT